MFAANYLWPQKTLGDEMLVLVVRLEQNQPFDDQTARRDRGAEPAAGRLQARGRVFAVGEGFSADGVTEDQARRTGVGDWGVRHELCRGDLAETAPRSPGAPKIW